MYCIVYNKAYIFVSSIKNYALKQYKNFMKKLLLFFALTIISLNTMAMGFPQNTYMQQRALTKNQKITAIKNITEVQTKLVSEVSEVSIEQDFSLVEMISDFIVKLFFREISSAKEVALKAKEAKLTHFDFVAIKQDFEYSVIG